MTTPRTIEQAIQSRGYTYVGSLGRGSYTYRRHYNGEFWTVTLRDGIVREWVERDRSLVAVREHAVRSRGLASVFATEPEGA